MAICFFKDSRRNSLTSRPSGKGSLHWVRPTWDGSFWIQVNWSRTLIYLSNPLTFAVFCWLYASYQFCPHSRRGDWLLWVILECCLPQDLSLLSFCMVYLGKFHCLGFSALAGEKSSRNKSLSPISITPRFCHYCSEVWEQEMTGNFSHSTPAP